VRTTRLSDLGLCV